MKYFKYLILVVFAFTNMFGQAKIKEYKITCDPSDFDYIYENYSEDIYIPATIEYNGKTWQDVRMRIRGDGSRIEKKKSLKLKFDGESFAHGRNTLNLNAEIADKSCMRPFLSSTIFNMAGITCFKAEHIRLYLNGEYFGLYIQIENMDEDFLISRGKDPKGNMFKATVDGASLRNVEEVEPLWEKKANESTGKEELANLIEELNSVPDSRFNEWFRETFDYDKMINILAMNMLLANGSTYSHNYYMYQDINNTGKWEMFPWDLDKTVAHYSVGFTYSQSPGAWFHDNPVLKRSILCEPIFTDIKKRVDVLAETVVNEATINPIIDSLLEILPESVENDKTDNIEALDDWEAEVEKNKEFIKYRYNQLLYQFEEFPTLFEAKRTIGTYTDDITLTWSASKSLVGRDDITYILHYGPKPYYDIEGAVKLEGLTDTTYTIPASSLKEGKYYWQVIAYDGKHWMVGFDHNNSFMFKKGSEFPCTIDKNTTLSLDKSPYIVNCNAMVNKNVTLTVEPGVEIHIRDSFNIYVSGNIICKGTKENPIRIQSSKDTEDWGFIKMEEASAKSVFEHMLIENCKFSAIKADYNMDNITIINDEVYIGEAALVWTIACNEAIIKNSKFIIDSATSLYGQSEGLYFKQTQAIIENCELWFVPDAIEISLADNCVVRGNKVYGSTDDAVDLNFCNDILIENNEFYNSKDKGVSITSDNGYPSSNITIRNNLFYGCFKALKTKDITNVDVYNNTFIDNKHPFEVLESSELDIANNIFNAKDFYIIKDDIAQYQIRYSCFSNEVQEGEGNFQDDPLFVNSEKFDFRLTSESPCIDAGDPNSPNDPDGTRADIGAYYFNHGNMDIIINEINYNSPDDKEAGDWVELYNPNAEIADLSGWFMKDDNAAHTYIFPDGTAIEPDDYLVVCNDEAAFKNIHGGIANLYGEFQFGLNGSGDQVRIYSLTGILIDSVEYDDQEPWPTEPDGNGPSLELVKPEYDNSRGENWHFSNENGTPGKKNDSYLSFVENEINNEIEIRNYPNPFKDYTIISFALPQASPVSIDIYNNMGEKKYSLVDADYLEANKYTFRLNSAGLSNGVYYVRLTYGSHSKILPIVIAEK